MASATVTNPVVTKKAIPLEIAGWIPYWRKATGTQETLLHMYDFKEISPFGFTVKNDGTIFDALKIEEEPWPLLFTAARAQKVKIFPTITWANGVAIDTVLRSPTKRAAHVKQIVELVQKYNFDGIDIDYEGKKATTKPYFSLFLKELYKAMGKKFVSCTIEARTPLTSRYDTIPKDIAYANDYTAVNAYCDRVRIMTYDQGSIDIRLNAKAVGPYIPVSDPAWVEKVITLASKTISKKKIFIGIPTYGYEYEVKELTEGYRYDLLWAFNQRYALDVASAFGITPYRNEAGELHFIYTPTSTAPLSSMVTTDAALTNNDLLATTSFASTTGGVAQQSQSPFRIVWWSDASAIQDKIDLAKKLGVRGVAIFKIDGGADPKMWNVLYGATH